MSVNVSVDEHGGSTTSPCPDCNVSNKAQLVPTNPSVCCLFAVCPGGLGQEGGGGMAGLVSTLQPEQRPHRPPPNTLCSQDQLP